MSARSLFGWTSLILALTCALHAQPSYAQKAGVASAIRNDVDGILGGSSRKLSSGASVFSSELIRTGDASLAQLTLLDETTLSVSAKSEVRITKFVYNPNRGSSSSLISASKGALRFVSGSSNPSSYKVDTPSATIGVRGTIIDILVWSDRATIILVEGAFAAIAKATGVTYNVNRPGQSLTITLDGTTSQNTWDATIYNFVGNAPFPLFGDNMWPNQRKIEAGDTRRDLNDTLNALSPRPRSSSSGSGGSGGGGGCGSFC